MPVVVLGAEEWRTSSGLVYWATGEKVTRKLDLEVRPDRFIVRYRNYVIV